MPSFYNTGLAPRMPPTLLPNYGGFLENDYSTAQIPIAQAAVSGQKHSTSCYGAQDHTRSSAAAQYQRYQSAVATQPSHFLDSKLYYPTAYTSSPRNEIAQYGPVSAPLLPPIHAPGPSAGDYHSQAQTTQVPAAPQEKEEKIGGVAAHLDYEMDVMVDFVSEMAQGMFDIFASKICLADIDMTRSILSSKSQAPRDFRKYVSQVLSSTRLPSSTILLALSYLSKRMLALSKKGYYGQSARDVYSMLTTALILGSKFLDDNTFQNRSWSEVSNIAVSELNLLEIQWLVDMKWDLHIDQDDPEGFQLWIYHWNRFQTNTDDASLANSMMRTSLDGNVPQRPPNSAMPKLPPINTDLLACRTDRPSTTVFANEHHGPWNTPQHVQWQQARTRNEYSPPSAPETGPNTPDAFGLLNSFTCALQPAHPGFKLPPASHILPSNAPPSNYPTPYVPQYSHYAQGSYCDSRFCTPQYERYLMAHGYPLQPVAA